MKFARMRMLGFKSFVDPTDVVIRDGLTGIVGPNGCGKSNLLEALKWAMGETSSRSMRGEGMEDVIFAGTAGRPSRNMAEVTLFVDNSARTAPAAWNDADTVEISRCIEKDKGSVYRINGRDVRAHDVRVFFADASTGSRSPALVRQGGIAEVVSAKPTARRRLLEEAAGITGLHSRRHEAELRLRAAESNLVRLDDVMTEQENHLGVLRRQARQATRYQNMSSRIRSAEALVLYLRDCEAAEAQDNETRHVKETDSSVEDHTRAAAAGTVALEKADGELTPLREAESEAAAAVHRLKVEREGLDAEEENIGAETTRLTAWQEQTTGDLRREQDQVTDSQGVLERLDSERQGLDSERQGLDSSEASQEFRSDQPSAQMEEAESALEVMEQDLAGRTAKLAGRKARVDELERTIRETGERLIRLRAAMEELDGGISPQSGQMESWSPVRESLQITDGCEIAVDAALGDSLDAPDDSGAPAWWKHLPGLSPLPALPEGVSSLLSHVRSPGGLLDRRLSQTGLVAASDGARLQGMLQPGQILVSREGDVWRWDGYTATPDAPQRLARRERLEELEREIESVRSMSSARLSHEAEECDRIAGEARQELENLPAAEALESGLETLRLDVESRRRALSELRAAHEGARREEEARLARLSAIDQEREQWSGRLSAARERIATLESRRTETDGLIASLRESAAAIEPRRHDLLDRLGEADKLRSSAAEALEAAEGRRAACDRELRRLEGVLATAREERARAQALLEGAVARRADIAARIREVLGCAAEEVFEQTGLKRSQDAGTLEKAEEKLDRLKRERETLGGVNLQAAEEMETLREKLESLTAEREDLERAISRLRQGIGRLNREGRERLLAAFENVNAKFGHLFEHLFGGGSAKLELLGADDPLEAGLEITAKPPGKKPRIMSLLSGGEQTLTAIALIFAILQTNPAPVCVLDEVDAALDDANVERFCSLLGEMVRMMEIPFLVITHHPLTMARMDCLYGVTMQERGVSALVSVDLETASRLRETA